MPPRVRNIMVPADLTTEPLTCSLYDTGAPQSPWLVAAVPLTSAVDYAPVGQASATALSAEGQQALATLCAELVALAPGVRAVPTEPPTPEAPVVP